MYPRANLAAIFAIGYPEALDARAEDSASFDFTPPGESAAGKYVCPSWSKSIPYNNRATIQATFREVFEP